MNRNFASTVQTTRTPHEVKRNDERRGSPGRGPAVRQIDQRGARVQRKPLPAPLDVVRTISLDNPNMSQTPSTFFRHLTHTPAMLREMDKVELTDDGKTVLRLGAD